MQTREEVEKKIGSQNNEAERKMRRKGKAKRR